MGLQRGDTCKKVRAEDASHHSKGFKQESFFPSKGKAEGSWLPIDQTLEQHKGTRFTKVCRRWEVRGASSCQ